MLILVAVAIPREGVVNEGEVAKTKAPDPVSSITADAKLALDGLPNKVDTPVPKPATPVDIGSPVAFVSVADDGVPNAGVIKVGLLDKTKLPVPVELVTPVPPFATPIVVPLQVPLVIVPTVVISVPTNFDAVILPARSLFIIELARLNFE